MDGAIQKEFWDSLNFFPEKLSEPFAWVGHIPFMGFLIKKIAPMIYVELGTHTGNSYFSACQAVKNNDLQTKCFAIDTWSGDDHAGYYENLVFEDVKKYNQENYSLFSTLMRMRFHDALSTFKDSSIDLLHIDGNHTYEAVKHDFETWLPKLAPGAIVLFHDISEKRNDFGVWKLWEELTKKYTHHFAFTHSHGLGVIQVNLQEGIQKSSWPLREFDDAATVKSFFEACGLRIQAKFQIDLLEIENDKFRSEVGKYHTLVTNRDQELVKLQHLNDALNVKISEYHTLVTNRDQELVKLQHLNDSLNVKISEYHNLASLLRARIDYIEGLIFWKIASKCKKKFLLLKRVSNDGIF